jgi:hypothetical protein
VQGLLMLPFLHLQLASRTRDEKNIESSREQRQEQQNVAKQATAGSE